MVAGAAESGDPSRRSGWTRSSTGARTLTVSTPSAVARRTSAGTTMTPASRRAPRTCGRVVRGSPVTTTSAVTFAYSAASVGTGPPRTSTACSAADVTETATHSDVTAPAMSTPRRGGRRPAAPVLARSPARSPPPVRPARRTAVEPLRRAITTSSTTRAQHPAATAAAVRPGSSRPIAAAAQAARAGGISRRSAGPSCRGSASPSWRPESACTVDRHLPRPCGAGVGIGVTGPVMG